MNNKVVHKIGDAIIEEKAVDLLSSWQSHDNEGLNGTVTYLLKAVSFLACATSQYVFVEEDKKKAMDHIINLSELAENLESFKK